MLLGWLKKILKNRDKVVETLDEEYQAVSPYLEIPLDAREERCVFLIAAAIAAGGLPSSQFQIKSIKRENPIYKQVSIIATSVAAADAMQSSFKIKAIKVRKG